MATIRDIAARVGVSPSEVSRVLRGQERRSRSVSEETRLKILEAARELNYQPNLIARALVTRRSHIVGAALYNITNPFFARIAMALESELRKSGLQMLLTTGERSEEPPAPAASGPSHLRHLELFLMYNVDGILFWNWERFSKQDELEWKSGRNRPPMVLLGRVDAEVAMDRVLIDQSAGGRMVTEHLLSRGYERIAFAGADTAWNDPYSKYRGYAEAMRRAGRKPQILADNVHTLEDGYRLGRRLAQMSDRPDAVVAGVDFVAMGLIRALHEAGLTVPSDLAVTGFDDNPVSAYAAVSLTTLRQPYVEAAESAVRLLLERIRERDGERNGGRGGERANQRVSGRKTERSSERSTGGTVLCSGNGVPGPGCDGLGGARPYRVIRLEPVLVVRESSLGPAVRR